MFQVLRVLLDSLSDTRTFTPLDFMKIALQILLLLFGTFGISIYIDWETSPLREKCPNTEFFLACIFSHLDSFHAVYEHPILGYLKLYQRLQYRKFQYVAAEMSWSRKTNWE